MHLYATDLVLLVATETVSESSYKNHLKRNGTVARIPVKLLHIIRIIIEIMRGKNPNLLALYTR